MEISINLSTKLTNIAKKAGYAIIEINKNSDQSLIESKFDGSPLTLADQKSHEIIVGSLSKMDGNLPIISEEGSLGNFVEKSFCYLVDPLDGTKEFLRGNGMYTVNIALMKKNLSGGWKPILGVVHAPDTGITWSGGVGLPPTRSDNAGTKKIRAGRSSKIPIILGSVSHSSPLDLSFAESIGNHIFEGVGSSIKICRVADGSADMAPRFGPTSCWDTAAAHAVLNAAGGNLLSPDGEEISYDVPGRILNPWYFATSNNKWKEEWIAHQKL